MKPRRYLNVDLSIKPELENSLRYFLYVDTGMKAASSVYKIKIAVFTDIMGWY